jgi:hypothetical protein
MHFGFAPVRPAIRAPRKPKINYRHHPFGRIVAHLATMYAPPSDQSGARRPERPSMPSLQRTMRGAIFVLLASLVLMAAPARAADAVFPLNSRIGLTPPPGFTPSAKFGGFENAQDSAVILLVELPAEAYADIEKGFTDEALKGRGMTVQAREPLTLKDGRGFFVSGPQESGGVKRHEIVMVASLQGVTTIVSLQMVQETRAKITDAVAKSTFATVAVRTVPDSERLAVLPYKLTDLAGFRLVRTAGDGSAILTDGPNDAVDAVEQPFVVIAIAPGETPKAEERDKFARRVFGGAPGLKDIKITRAEPLRIGNMQGYEIVAEAKDKSTSTEVNAVQWLRFGGNGYLQIFAIARRTTWNDVFPKLRTIRDSIEMK